MNESIYPLLFCPVLKHYPWGGRNLENLGRTLPPGQVAESWEIAAHEDGASIIANGHFKGKSLSELHEILGLDLIGRESQWAQERGKFPLLVKLLDANKPLSVQVHPDDSYALLHEGNELGKTEMWVVLHAKPGAEIILGLRENVTPEEFRAALADDSLEPLLHAIKVQAGDHICVPAGSLHAIMDGLLIAEIQQNSNTTYRVYDWNRSTADGQRRPLHIDKALDVIDFDQVAPIMPEPKLIASNDGVCRSLLCRNEYFTAEQVTMEPGCSFHGDCAGRTFEIWGVTDGRVEIRTATDTVLLEAVGFALLPAVLGPFSVSAPTQANLLRAYVGAPE